MNVFYVTAFGFVGCSCFCFSFRDAQNLFHSVLMVSSVGRMINHGHIQKYPRTVPSYSTGINFVCYYAGQLSTFPGTHPER